MSSSDSSDDEYSEGSEPSESGSTRSPTNTTRPSGKSIHSYSTSVGDRLPDKQAKADAAITFPKETPSGSASTKAPSASAKSGEKGKDEGSKKRTERDDSITVFPKSSERKSVPTDKEKKKTSICRDIRNYPAGVFFMLGNEFCERFSFYGMRAVLTLYLVTEHGLPESTAMLIFHAFVTVCYFSPLLGSIIADGYLGRFKVILYFSIVYCLGHVLLTLGAVPQLGKAGHIVDYCGLAVIAIATGGIKPCVSAFAADQFPDHMGRERAQFFSFFYFAINAGALISKIITPIFRGGIPCLGKPTCFPLAFGVPGILMVVATIIFVAGWKFYTIYPRSGENIICQVLGIICRGCRNRTAGKRPSCQGVLDYADDKYDPDLISDTKNLLRILPIFIPLILFWALFDQQGSTWVLQANRMNGRVGHLTILPDQVSMLNPALVIILIPLFEGLIYPCLTRCNLLRSPLKRMAAGGILAAVSFVIAGFLQLEINKSMVQLPESGMHRFVVQNMLPCTVTLQPSATLVDSRLSLKVDLENLDYIDLDPSCGFNHTNLPVVVQYGDSTTGYVVSLVPGESGNQSEAIVETFHMEKIPGKTDLMAAVAGSFNFTDISLIAVLAGTEKKDAEAIPLKKEGGTVLSMKLPIVSEESSFDVFLKDCSHEPCSYQPVVENFESKMGALFSIVFVSSKKWSTPIEIVPANTVNILLMIPQYVVITVGEILLSITGLEFSYSQAAPSLKSVVQAMWLMTTAFGNAIDMIISGSHIIPEPHWEFFFYAGMMTVVMVIFIVVAVRYKYVDYKHKEDDESAGKKYKKK